MGKVKVLLNTAKWGQGSPFYLQCPRYNGQYTIIGCEATAMAIIMKYYEYPEHGYGTTAAYTTPLHGLAVKARNLEEHQYNWNLPTQPADWNTATSALKNDAATIGADISAAINADYDTYCTDAYIRYWFPALTRHFGYHLDRKVLRDFKEWDYENECYTRWTDEEWLGMIEEELDKGHPILYHATLPAGFMHVFVIDGYTDKHYLHVNYGWGGNSDGYYTLDEIGGNQPWSYMWLGLVPMNEADEDVKFSIGDRECITMSEALDIAAIADGVPVKMLEEFILTNESNSSELHGKDDRPQPSVTSCLDLNGHQLQLLNDYYYYTTEGEEGSKLYFPRITDSQGTGSIYIPYGMYFEEKDANVELESIRIEGGDEWEYSSLFVMYGGHLKLHDVTINKPNDGACFVMDNGATLELDGVRIKATQLFRTYIDFRSSIICRSGLFSVPVEDKYLAEGSVCEPNTDEATRAEYPYRVVSTTGINGTNSNTVPATPVKRIQGQHVVIQLDDKLYDTNGARIK
ncbi:MAG: C10 family peptidase [Bacteroidales bacterium]|nr:C10 family peptidase [Bacteroidales bacterium]